MGLAGNFIDPAGRHRVTDLKKHCPLTVLARKYSDSTKDNFDIFLPNWLARYNKLIYTSFFVVILLILLYRLISNK